MDSVPEVAVTIAGFSGLLVVLRPRTEKLSRVERYRIYFLLATSLGAALLGMLPGVIRPYLDQAVSATLLCAAGALSLATLAVWRMYLLRQLTDIAASLTLFPRVLGYINWLLVGAAVLAVFGLIHRDFMFDLILWWLVFAAVGQFAVHIVSVLETREKS